MLRTLNRKADDGRSKAKHSEIVVDEDNHDKNSLVIAFVFLLILKQAKQLG